MKESSSFDQRHSVPLEADVDRLKRIRNALAGEVDTALELEIWRAYLNKYDGMPPWRDEQYAKANYESFSKRYLERMLVALSSSE